MQQHYVRISYGVNMDDHSTYIVCVPLDDGDFPYALVKAVEKAGDELLRSVARDISPHDARPTCNPCSCRPVVVRSTHDLLDQIYAEAKLLVEHYERGYGTAASWSAEALRLLFKRNRRKFD